MQLITKSKLRVIKLYMLNPLVDKLLTLTFLVCILTYALLIQPDWVNGSAYFCKQTAATYFLQD